MILLDTHALIWLAAGTNDLGSRALRAIEEQPERRMSAMVAWELAMLVDKRRIALESPLDIWLDQAMRGFGIVEVPISSAIGRDAGGLQGNIHGDPYDRIMVATARALRCPLVTSDRAILRYAANGHLKAIDARR
jgi:PIN domain nuclease of toxin-antitoxin system